MRPSRCASRPVRRRCMCPRCVQFPVALPTCAAAAAPLQVFISSMGREPVVVNGAPVTSPLELATGDKIEVGLQRCTCLQVATCPAVAIALSWLQPPVCPSRAVSASPLPSPPLPCPTQVLLENRSRVFYFQGEDETVQIRGAARPPLADANAAPLAMAAGGWQHGMEELEQCWALALPPSVQQPGS